MAYDLEINTSQELDLGDLTILDGASKFTILTIVNEESQAAAARTVVGRDNAGNSSIRLYESDSGNTNGKVHIPKLLVTVGGTTVRAEGNADNQFPVGAWVRFGGRFQAGVSDGVAVFLDGVRKDTGPNSTTGLSGQTIADIANSYYFGRRGATSNRWDGLIGEIAIYDEFLSDAEMELHGLGVSALAIRPESLVLYWDGNSDKVWLPRSNSFSAITFVASPPKVDDTYGLILPAIDDGPSEMSPPAATYGSWQLLRVMEAQAASHLDTTAVNGTTYQYALISVDTSGNRSALSSASADVTPAAGIAGPPVVFRMPGQTAREARARRGRRMRR